MEMKSFVNGLKRLAARAWITLPLIAVLPAHGQITYPGIAPRTAAASAASLTIARPAGMAVNDLMIAVLAQRGQNANPVATSAGWTRINGANNGGTLGVDAYWKLATAAEPASYTWAMTRNARISGTIYVFRGVDTAAPVVSSGVQVNAVASTTYTAPSISTGIVTNTMLVAVYARTNAAGAISAATGMTLINSRSSGGAAAGLVAGSSRALQAAAGFTGAKLSTANTSSASLGMLIALRPLTASVGSFGINTGGATGNTCAPKNITITARDTLGATLIGYTGTVNLTTSTGRGDWAVVTANGALNNGAANDGAASYTFVAADNGVITLALTNRSPDAALTLTAVDSVAPASSTTSTAIAFSDSAFLFTLDPVQVAGRNQAISVALWAKSSVTAATCTVVTTYSGLKNLKAWIARDALDPAGAAPQIGVLNLPNAQPGANNLATLNFVAGVASFNLSSTDVGKYALNLRDDTSPFTTPAVGTSNLITTRPFGLAITNVRQGATLNAGGTAAAGAAFVAAGDTFQATIASYLWAATDDVNNDGVPDVGADITNNGTTPSFRWPVTLSAAAPFTPAAGALGTLGGTTAILPASFAAGAATVANLTYSEAGSMTLQAVTVNFLGSAGVNYSATSGAVGRFFADHFLLLPGASVTPACGTFTYMGQALSSLSFSIEAQAKTSNTRLNNYDTASNSFAIAAVSVLAEDTGVGNDGVPKSARVSGVPVPAPAWVAGRYIVSTAAAVFDRAAAPDGPYTALQLGVQVTADPNGALLAARDMNPGTAGVCAGAGCTGVKLNAVLTAVRYGRLRLINGVNSQLLPATLIAEAQYYLGSAGSFTANTFDSCTPLSAANFTLGNGQGIATSAVQINMVSGNLVSGRKTLTVSKAGNSAVGPGGIAKSSVDVGLNLGATASGQFCSGAFAANTGAALAHLRARWCTAPATWDRDPVARAAFGIYAGSDRLLLLRENY
jgi:hypothetical protein